MVVAGRSGDLSPQLPAIPTHRPQADSNSWSRRGLSRLGLDKEAEAYQQKGLPKMEPEVQEVGRGVAGSEGTGVKGPKGNLRKILKSVGGHGLSARWGGTWPS